MPLPKRVIEPVHIARGTLPDDFPLPSELEAVTNGTLANTIRQLSSLSRHAEDLFGELARDAQQLYDRSNSLQARIDRLAVKVTQLDSNVEEVSLQDIHIRKAFKSAVVFDQQIFSRATMPTAMLETYNSCDRPPPLDKLNCYRDDGKDGLKFYTDPNYFFELWRQEILNDTERVMHDRGKRPHRPRTADGGQGGNRHKKRVRQPHNTRERQKQIAVGHGEYIMPLNTIYRTPSQSQTTNPYQAASYAGAATASAVNSGGSATYASNDVGAYDERPPRPNSIEIRRSYNADTMVDGVSSPPPPPPSTDDAMVGGGAPNNVPHPYQYGQGPLSSDSLYQSGSGGGTPTRTAKIRPSQPPPAPPSQAGTPTRARSMSTGRDNLPPPPPPPDVMLTSPPPPLPPNGLPPHLSPAIDATSIPIDLPPPPPAPKQPSPPAAIAPPPPPPPPPMPVDGHGDHTAATSSSSPPPPPPPVAGLANGDLAKILNSSTPPKLTPVKDRVINTSKLLPPPMVDPRNDLLKAIRDGIKLRKVEKIEQKEVERGNGLHDVASILARRVAVEFSDSDSASDSDCDSEGWGENETSA